MRQPSFSPPKSVLTRSTHGPTPWASRSVIILVLLALPVFSYLTFKNIQAHVGWLLILRPPAIGLLLVSLPMAIGSIAQFVATTFLGYTDKSVFRGTVAISCWPLIVLLLIFGAGMLLTEVHLG